MKHYDFCVAWNWKHDADFIRLLSEACRSRDLAFLEITPANLQEMIGALEERQLSCRAFLDRASDEDDSFIAIDRWSRQHEILRINPRELAVRAWNKAAMHYILIDAGLITPHTIIIPPHAEHPDLRWLDFSSLGESFVIKPAHGGGGEGVVTEASSWEDVLAARRRHPKDQYLLQRHIAPLRVGSRPAWFRVIYCAGRIYPCWWDPRIHIYIPVSPEEETAYGFGALRKITSTLHRICGLGLFSTEIAFSSEEQWVVVDYINDQIDLRLQSRTPDGIPDTIAREMAGHLIDMINGDHRPDPASAAVS
jgi:hypothetical protein